MVLYFAMRLILAFAVCWFDYLSLCFVYLGWCFRLVCFDLHVYCIVVGTFGRGFLVGISSSWLTLVGCLLFVISVVAGWLIWFLFVCLFCCFGFVV